MERTQNRSGLGGSGNGQKQQTPGRRALDFGSITVFDMHSTSSHSIQARQQCFYENKRHALNHLMRCDVFSLAIAHRQTCISHLLSCLSPRSGMCRRFKPRSAGGKPYCFARQQNHNGAAARRKKKFTRSLSSPLTSVFQQPSILASKWCVIQSYRGNLCSNIQY